MKIASSCYKGGKTSLIGYKGYQEYRGTGRRRGGEPIEKFLEASERLEQAFNSGESIDGLHPFCPSTPIETVLAGTRVCREAVNYLTESHDNAIESVEDFVSSAEQVERYEANQARFAAERLDRTMRGSRRKYLVAAALAGAAAVTGALLASSPAQGAVFSLGILGFGGAVISSSMQETDKTISLYQDWSNQANRELESASSYYETAKAWGDFVS